MRVFPGLTNEAEKIYLAAMHPKSFVSLDKADHLLSNRKDAEYVATTIAAWVSRYLDTESEAVQGQPVAGGTVKVGEQNQKFTRIVQSDTHRWLADEPLMVGGRDLGPDPYEHLLAALGTCTFMTIRMYANRKKMSLDDIVVSLSHTQEHRKGCEECEDQPRKIGVLHREISFKGDLSMEETRRLMEIADKCPVHKTLLGEIDISSDHVEWIAL